MQFWATFAVEISREKTNKSPNVAPLRLDINSCLKHKKRWKRRLKRCTKCRDNKS